MGGGSGGERCRGLVLVLRTSGKQILGTFGRKSPPGNDEWGAGWRRRDKRGKRAQGCF